MPVNTAYKDMDNLEQGVLSALRQVVAHDGADILSSGQVYDVVATGGAVRVLLDLERIPDGLQESLAETISAMVESLPGVQRAIVKPRPNSIAERDALPGIQHVVAVHSGKGGVGKSTLTANLAVALSAQGYRVGLLDADVYGPSAHILLGESARAEIVEKGERIEPKERFGVRMMSLGLLLPEEQALIWRGSLVDEGLPQLFHHVDWGELDLLLLDLPPGTSDVHLAVAQTVALSGVIAVTTPGQVSIDDVRRGMEMFADLAVPCLGLVENMAGINCRKCGHSGPLFGKGGGADLVHLTGLPLLATLPFIPAVASGSEQGVPVATDDTGVGAVFHELAAILAARVGLAISAGEMS